MDAEHAHRLLVRRCVDQIYSVAPSPALKPHVRALIEAERIETAEKVIALVREWDRGDRP